MRGRPSQPRIEPMKARRMAYWWFRFVASGRFLEKFLKLRRPWSAAAAVVGSWSHSRKPDDVSRPGDFRGARRVASRSEAGLGAEQRPVEVY